MEPKRLMRITDRVAELIERREPFVHATVVRRQVPSSVHAGDEAIVRADGRIEGFVGGQCASASVRAAARGVLDSGESLLLRILPDGSDGFPETEGASVVVNPCLSGGALEIFLDPFLPPPVCYVVGDSPVAEAVAAVAELLGFDIRRSGDDDAVAGTAAMVIASHGGDEEKAIREALAVDAGYIGLVASRRRAEAVLGQMDLAEAERAAVHSPAGLSIGARTPAEVAVSIMAEIVQQLRTGLPRPPEAMAPAGAPAAPPQAVDPVCGMTVTITPETPRLQLDGEDHWFCCPGCRDRFAAEHA